MNGQLLKIAAAVLPLYAGPVLAGLSGADWQVIPAFAAIFCLWLILMRPALTAGGMTRALWLRLNTIVAIQLGLVALLWGIGLLLQPNPPLALSWFWPLGFSALSIPLSRFLVPPMTTEMEEFLQDATDGINGDQLKSRSADNDRRTDD